MHPRDAKIHAMAAEALEAHGLVPVCVRFTGSGKFLTLQVLAEKPDGAGGFVSPTLDECTAASRQLGRELELADLISGRYVLEVGSPGLERPLLTADDCRRFIGKQAKFKFRHGQEVLVNGQPLGAVVATVLAVDGDMLTVRAEESREPLAFAFAGVHAAQLAPSAADYAALMASANRKTDTKPTH